MGVIALIWPFYLQYYIMRKILTLFFVVLAIFDLSAHDRDEKDKETIARVVLGRQAALAGVDLMASVPLEILCVKDGLTVVGRRDGGFAIIGNDLESPELIGYSDGVFNPDANPALNWFLTSAGRVLEEQRRTGQSHSPFIPEGPYKTDVAPLVSSQWDQGSPYNKQCPKLSGRTPYPTGCVATAMAQIMNYWKYPEQGQGEATLSVTVNGIGDIISADFSQATYRWDLMLDDYASEEYTTEQADAVALLMLHCGIGAGMSYSPSGSGTLSRMARVALSKHFKYNPNIDLLHREFFSLEQWMNYLYMELNEKRPVYYAASDANGGDGHAFVIDGYDRQGFVHVNWGWGPAGGNGYFDISLLNVSSSQYSAGQEMVTHISPSVINDYTVHIACNGGISSSLFSKRLRFSANSLYNVTGERVSGEIALIVEGEGGRYILKTQPFKETAHLNTLDASLDGLYSLPEGMPDGKYMLYMGAKTARDTDWRPVHTREGSDNHAEFQLTGGSLSGLEMSSSDIWTGVTAAKSDELTAGEATTRVFDASGHLVYSAPTSSFNLWDIPARGVLVVKQGENAYKIVR